MARNQHCANCGHFIEFENDGVSELYFPNGYDILLCEPCWFDENELVDEEGNNQPERLAHYLNTIEQLG